MGLYDLVPYSIVNVQGRLLQLYRTYQCNAMLIEAKRHYWSKPASIASYAFEQGCISLVLSRAISHFLTILKSSLEPTLHNVRDGS